MTGVSLGLYCDCVSRCENEGAYRSQGTRSIGLISARIVLARFEQLVKGMKLHAQGLLR